MNGKIALLMSSLLVLAVPRAYATNEAIAFGVDEFEGRCSGYTSLDGSRETGKDTLYSTDTAEKVIDVFSDWISSGSWDQAELKKNLSLDAEDLTDASKQSWGQDSVVGRGVDFADVAFVMTHMKATSTAIEIMVGDTASGYCEVYTSSDMLFGNGTGNDLEIFIASGCQSGQKDVYDAGGFNQVRTTDGGLNTWLGFHGDLVAGTFYDSNVKHYVKNSYSSGLGSNWLDGLYVWDVSFEVCPVAITWGDSADHEKSVYSYGGMADRNNDGSGSKTHQGFHYLKGCNPKDGSKLPS